MLCSFVRGVHGAICPRTLRSIAKRTLLLGASLSGRIYDPAPQLDVSGVKQSRQISRHEIARGIAEADDSYVKGKLRLEDAFLDGRRSAHTNRG
jgi:hypothetical protein